MTYFTYFFKYLIQRIYTIYQKILIVTYYIFLLLLLKQNLYKYHYINCIAFNTYFLYSYSDISSTYRIKKIYLLNANKKVFYMESLFTNKSYLKRKVKNYLSRLKFSGFISSINYTKFFVNSSRYYIVNIKYNGLVKKVKIKKFSNLIIPNYKLTQLFREQIGLPKNYKLIYKSIKSLLFWYHIQGFVWAKVLLINDKDFNSISLIINEGKIIGSKIICINTNQCKNHQLINNNIRSILLLNKGRILNKKKLEIQLKIIQQIYNIGNINYIIKFCNEGLHITIKYRINNNYFTKINFLPYLNENYFNLFTSYLFIKSNHTNNIFINQYFYNYFVKLQKISHKYIYIKLNFNSYKFYLYKYIKNFLYNSLCYLYNHSENTANYINILKQTINKNLFSKDIYLLSILRITFINVCQVNDILHLKQKIQYYLYSYNQFFLEIYSLKKLSSKLVKKYFSTTMSIFSLYTIQIDHKFSSLFFGGINTIKLKSDYYLLNKHNFYYNFVNIKIANKFHQKLYKHIFYYTFQYHISNILINRILLIQYSLINSGQSMLNIDKSFIIIRLKYNLLFNKYQSLYIFNHYLFNFNINNNFNFYNNKYNNFAGCGLQLNLPFKQMTTIRLEYIVNTKTAFIY